MTLSDKIKFSLIAGVATCYVLVAVAAGLAVPAAAIYAIYYFATH
jgi:hypothetical protein